MNEKMKLGAAFLVLLGCGLWLTYYYRTKPTAGAPVAHMQPLSCAACGAAFAAEAGALPTKCIKCGKNEAYMALKCRECKAIFPLVRNEQTFVSTGNIKCNKCGKSKYTTEVSPNDLPK